MIKILDMRLKNFETTKAYVDIDYYGLVVSGLKVVALKNGTGFFVSMPREKGKDEKYYDVCHPSNLDIKLEIENLILNKFYDMKKAEQQLGQQA